MLVKGVEDASSSLNFQTLVRDHTNKEGIPSNCLKDQNDVGNPEIT
jgi:hypothetical protein